MTSLLNGTDAKKNGVQQVIDLENDMLLLHDDMAWFASLMGRIRRGTNILVSGDPGVGKSTLAQQLAISAARAGEKALIIATEQSRVSVVHRLDSLSLTLNKDASDSGSEIEIIDDIGDLAVLPQFLARHVFSRAGRLQGTSLVVIDSLHGLGNSPGDRRFYSAIYEYFRNASAAGVTTVALAHMTKDRQVSGPRALEHMIDASIVMRHGVSCRALYVPKNRNGASRTEPLALVVDEQNGRIIPSPLTVASSARVRTISTDGPITIEVALTLPRHERGFVKGPGLAIKEIEIVVDLMARIYAPAKALGSLGVTVRAPGGIRFRREHSLPVAIGIAAALARVEVSDQLIVIGDVDLRGNVCTLGPSTLRLIEDGYTAGLLSSHDVIVAAPINDAPGIDSSAWNFAHVSTIQDSIAKCLSSHASKSEGPLS